MKISCNNIKKHIKNCDDINWLTIWDKFTIRTAEVEEVIQKGHDLHGVVVAKIVECKPHPTKEKYHVLKVDQGDKIVDILCGAPNVKEGIKVPLIKVGGSIQGFTIEPKKIAGVLSNGMLCSGKELGISDDHEGILIFPDSFEIGKSIKDYLPIDDIIVEIDNKSLTNRPDLWGHYGIAREIAAITNHELIALPMMEIPDGKEKLNITIKNPELCYRYCGLKIGNINNTKTPYDMQIFLHYCGSRSISLLVDLTNYLMLELGQPMHAFDSRVVKKIEIGLAKNDSDFVTLDKEKRSISNNTMMIKNGQEYFAIAGVMGGLESEILADTTSIVLESACFNAENIRKTACSLGLRTESSARYEKSLDPNMTDIAIKRFSYLLKQENPELEFLTSLTDVYPTKQKQNIIELEKINLKKYMGFVIDDSFVENTLTSLGFKVKTMKNKYKITVPTYRSTKDVELQADIIEEISRMYGYENFKPEPLKLPLKFDVLDNTFENEYHVKRFLATKYSLNEVNSYLWYKDSFLNRFGIEKQNISLKGKNKDKILRDDLSLSLIEIASENLKYQEFRGIFEIGTEIIENNNKRKLGIILLSNDDELAKKYKQIKTICSQLFKTFKNEEVIYKQSNSKEYYIKELAKDIIVNNLVIGTINVFKKNIAHHKIIVQAEIDFDLFCELPKKEIVFQDISKYQQVTLDYSIILEGGMKYDYLEKILNEFKSPIIIKRELIDIYDLKQEKRFTIRYYLGSNEKTLNKEEIEDFQEKMIKYIKNKELRIVE